MVRGVAATALAAGALGLAPGVADRNAAGPQVVRSADGLLTLSIPAGALPAGTSATIRPVSTATLPAAIRARAVNGPAYELLPAGLHFAKPVMITRRVHGTFRGGIPGLVLVSSETPGRWEQLAQPTIRWDPRVPSLTISATTTHFSTVAVFDDTARFSLTPDPVTRRVGTFFQAVFHVAAPHTDLVEVDLIRFKASPQTDPRDEQALLRNVTYVAQYKCTRAGTGEYGVTVWIHDTTPEQEILNVFAGGAPLVRLLLQAKATCTAPPPAPPPKPRLVTGCAMVTHTALGSFPSFLDFVLGFDPKSLPASPTATLQATGINDDQPVTGPVDATTGKADLKAGIRSFGTYSVGTVAVNGVAVDVSSIFGTLTVTATPGTIAGTCP